MLSTIVSIKLERLQNVKAFWVGKLKGKIKAPWVYKVYFRLVICFPNSEKNIWALKAL